jgi:hypothetical protein
MNLSHVLVFLAGVSQPSDRWDRREDTPVMTLTLPNAGTIRRWKIVRVTGGIALQVHEPGKYGGWYLNYDHRGNDAALLLTPERGPGCVWVLKEVRRGEIRGGPESKQVIAATITAAEGAMKGWYLTADPRAKLRNERVEIEYHIDVFDRNSGK